MGQEGKLKWTFWAATFHRSAQTVLKRLHSAGDYGPDYRDLSTSPYSYSQVRSDPRWSMHQYLWYWSDPGMAREAYRVFCN